MKKEFKKICLHMKKAGMLSLAAVMLLASFSTYPVYGAEPGDLTVKTNPYLKSYDIPDPSKTWVMDESTRLGILVTENNIKNERLKEVVKLVNGELTEKQIVSTNPLIMTFISEGSQAAKDVLVNVVPVAQISDQTQSDEAYKITIGDKGVLIEGASENAVLYGLRTLQNLMVTNKGLKYGTIIDYPNVAERRLHVDCGRKYFSKDWFIREIREMSFLKMNTLQMHFAENLGFRIECETDPAIVSPERLTKAEVREILAEAKKYGVKVIPSLDTPGHVEHILKVHPEYGQINNRGVHSKTGMDVTNPEAVAYFRSLYSEYMDLFEGCTDFHIGGDEYMEFDRPPFTTEYKSVLDDYARTSLGDGYIWKDVLSNYINELAAFVQSRGFKPRVWNDGLYYGESGWGATPGKINMHQYIGIDFWSQMSWNRSIARLQKFIDKGHTDIYNVNASFFYYVLRPTMPNDGREQHSFDNLNPDRKIYDEWTPGKFQENTISDDTPQIKGAAMAIWCDKPDLVGEDVVMEDIASSMRALATKAWNTASNSKADYAEFSELTAKLGHVAGFEKGSQLPDVGEFKNAEDMGNVVLKYLDKEQSPVKTQETKIGMIGDDFSFTAPEVYGYRLVSEDATFTGQYTKEEQTHIFEYELYTDKAALKAALDLEKLEPNYIEETYGDYKEALAIAKAAYENPTSKQKEVDDALEALVKAEEKLVPLEYFALYGESTYPLPDSGYITGYPDYDAAVKEGKALLKDHSLTKEKAAEALNNILDAKAKLKKADGDKPTVTSTASHYTYGGWGTWFPNDKYDLNKMTDGKLDTKTWFASNQRTDQEIVFTFPELVNMTGIQIVQPTEVGGDLLKSVDVEVAGADNLYKKVGTLTEEGGRDQNFEFEKTPVQHVRLTLKEDKQTWYQIAEVIFTKEPVVVTETLPALLKEAIETDFQGKDQGLVKNLADAFLAAHKASVQGEEDTIQVETALRNAIDAIKAAPLLDRSKLEALITSCDEINLNLYTKASGDALTETLEAAKKVVETAKTQKEIDDAKTALETAKTQLILKAPKGDINTLKAAVAEAKGLKEKYNLALEGFITKAEELLKAEEDSISADSVTAALTEYKEAKEKAEADADKVIEALNKDFEALNKDDYTPETVTALENALNDLKAAEGLEPKLENIEKVKLAVKALKKIELDFTKLNALITESEKIDPKAYTDSTAGVFTEKLAAAKNIANSAKTQKEIDDAKAALEDAKTQLVKKATKPEVDKLKAVLENAKELAEKYNLDFDAVITQAENSLQNEGELTSETVDTHIKAIEDAIAKSPVISEGANQVVAAGKPATFKSTADFKDFEKVLVDEKEVAPENYTAVSGSTVVTLKPAFTGTLTAGKHTISIVSKKGVASAEFTVSEKSDNDGNGGNNNDNGETNGKDKPGNKDSETKAATSKNVNASRAKFGDTTPITALAVLLLVSGGAVALLVYRKAKKSHQA